MATANACDRRSRDRDTVTTSEWSAILARYTDAVTTLPGLRLLLPATSLTAVRLQGEGEGQPRQMRAAAEGRLEEEEGEGEEEEGPCSWLWGPARTYRQRWVKRNRKR
jgi:hypothetical protein